MDLWLPFDAEREQQIDYATSQAREARRLEAELKGMDPHLSVVFVGPRAPGAPGIVPGAWHIRRENAETIDSYWPILNPDGSPAPP